MKRAEIWSVWGPWSGCKLPSWWSDDEVVFSTDHYCLQGPMGTLLYASQENFSTSGIETQNFDFDVMIAIWATIVCLLLVFHLFMRVLDFSIDCVLSFLAYFTVVVFWCIITQTLVFLCSYKTSEFLVNIFLRFYLHFIHMFLNSFLDFTLGMIILYGVPHIHHSLPVALFPWWLKEMDTRLVLNFNTIIWSV